MPLLYLLAAIAIGFVLLKPKQALAYVQGVATEINLAPIGNGFYMRQDAANAFLYMSGAAARAGVTLKVNSAFRTNDEQTELYNEKLAGTRTDAVARPGYSNHQSGIAVDIEVERSQNSKTYIWLANNALNYGYINTGINFGELWHWEFSASDYA